jgi:limonene-1,2-epoxide hydrolase
MPFFILTLSTCICPAFSNEIVPQNRSELIRWAFNTLDSDNMDIIEDFYHDDAHFVDPVVDAKGLMEIRAHYEHQYKSVAEIRFDIIEEHISGDTYTLEWEMTLKTKRLNKGETFVVPGASVLKFSDNKVSYHRDYFDLGDMVYERIPVIRYITKKIKHRLHFSSKKGK